MFRNIPKDLNTIIYQMLPTIQDKLNFSATSKRHTGFFKDSNALLKRTYEKYHAIMQMFEKLEAKNQFDITFNYFSFFCDLLAKALGFSREEIMVTNVFEIAFAEHAFFLARSRAFGKALHQANFKIEGNSLFNVSFFTSENWQDQELQIRYYDLSLQQMIDIVEIYRSYYKLDVKVSRLTDAYDQKYLAIAPFKDFCKNCLPFLTEKPLAFCSNLDLITQFKRLREAHFSKMTQQSECDLSEAVVVEDEPIEKKKPTKENKWCITF